jgi:hypothetical protein
MLSSPFLRIARRRGLACRVARNCKNIRREILLYYDCNIKEE